MPPQRVTWHLWRTAAGQTAATDSYAGHSPPAWRLERTGLTPLQACVAYVLSVAEVDRVIVGVDSLVQLNQIFIASKSVLPSLPDWPQPIDMKLINPGLWSQL